MVMERKKLTVRKVASKNKNIKSRYENSMEKVVIFSATKPFASGIVL